MEVWKIIFLSKLVICRFHVNLPGCSFSPLFTGFLAPSKRWLALGISEPSTAAPENLPGPNRKGSPHHFSGVNPLLNFLGCYICTQNRQPCVFQNPGARRFIFFHCQLCFHSLYYTHSTLRRPPVHLPRSRQMYIKPFKNLCDLCKERL